MSLLGEKLQTQREKHALSLEKVAAATRIPLQTLKAFETAEWSQLPAKPYACGFVKSYGKYLGLSPDECLKLFEEEIQDHNELRLPAELSEVPEPQLLTETQSLLWLQAPKTWFVIGLILVISALAFVTLLAFQKMSSYNAEKNFPGKTVSAPTLQTDTATADNKEELDLTLPIPTWKKLETSASATFRTVSFYASQPTQFTIHWANGKTQDVTMEANEIKNIRYYRPLRIVAPNSQALKVRQRDKKFIPLSKKSGLTELRYP